MGVIKHLPEIVISRIAAGEVIERPAYIIKELIENSIDADSNHIQIFLEKKGRSKIIVQDNGVGMDRDDIALCFKPHTTSKIVSETDLITVKSLGFRGEALASIAAIGVLTIRSRSQNASIGTEVILKRGIEKASPIGMPRGTQIIVEDIFGQVPVRKHFLQTQSQEYRLILDIVTRFAIAFPHISFDLTTDEKRVYTVPSADTLMRRAEDLIPHATLHQLIPFASTIDDIIVEGYLSPPQIQYKTQRNMHFYINKRFIREPLFTATVKDVYGTLLEPISYPYALVFISLPHHLIDVNVHPRKETVHMLERERVLSVLKKTLAKTLSDQELKWEMPDGGTNTYAASVLKGAVIPPKKQRKPIQVTDIVQVHDTYLVIPTENGILMIDQHAADERVLFEKFQDAFMSEKDKMISHRLPENIRLELSAGEHDLIDEKLDEMRRLGFEIEKQDDNFFVFAVPSLFKDRDIQAFMRDVLDDLLGDSTVAAFDRFSNTMLEYLACRSAIKAGDTITKAQAKELIEKLNKTQNPYTCPHGRPIQISVGLNYLHRLFKRK